jgi:choline dehydrogenase-like flavoprotein
MPRFKPDDFRMRSTDGVGLDWPITYDDLAPFYELGECLQGIAVRPGDPLAPPRTGRYLEPLPIGAAGRRLAEAFDRLGWHWWLVDRVLGEAARPEKACTHVGPCDFGCPIGRQASADRTLWPKAIAAGARLVTKARVQSFEHDSAGQVKAAIWRDDGGTLRRTRADLFLLAANGIGTPRLLLLSASGRYPNGLANGSGLLDRNLMLHPYASVSGRFEEPLSAAGEGATSGVISHQFYRTDRSRGFVRGLKLQLAPGADLLVTVCAEDLPEPENRVALSEEVRDRDGRPAAKLIYRVSENSRRILDFGLDRAAEALSEAGAIEISRNPLMADAGFHLMGTARMGTDPDAAVVDPFGRVHEHANLFIVDSSVFVTSAAVTPTNTALALALRTAEHIVVTRGREGRLGARRRLRPSDRIRSRE